MSSDHCKGPARRQPPRPAACPKQGAVPRGPSDVYRPRVRARRCGCGRGARRVRPRPCRRRSCRCAPAFVISSATCARRRRRRAPRCDLRHELDRVLGAAVHLGVPALATESLRPRDGDAGQAELCERLLHVVELERLDERGDELHDSSDPLPRGATAGTSTAAPSEWPADVRGAARSRGSRARRTPERRGLGSRPRATRGSG